MKDGLLAMLLMAEFITFGALWAKTNHFHFLEETLISVFNAGQYHRVICVDTHGGRT